VFRFSFATTTNFMFIIEILLLLYFGFVSTYQFVLSVAGLFFRAPQPPESAIKRKIAVLIPSYKEDGVIVSSAQHALEQNYPADRFDVVVIADSLQPQTVANLKALPIKVVEVSFDKSTKVKSLNSAFAAIGDQYDYALILDADNVMEKDFLKKINNMLGMGYRAIQGERTSKNETTSMSILDGFSERINNFIYRQGHVAAGLSCSLIGSGMIFEYSVVKDILSKLKSVGGFDRELELDLIRRGIRIYYGKGAVVYDEKVESTEVFEKQRTRWLSSQFVYLRKYFFEGWSCLFTGHIAMFNSAILKNVQLPRLINLGFLIILVVLAYILRPYLDYGIWPWIAFLAMNILAMCFAIPLRYYNWQMVKSIFLLPKVFVKMFNLLFRLKGANKTFIHTPHGVTNVTVNEKK
jgi:cellulose synthase/poly-beta-1,6-N-acetylglucosamine synthase-like glycosyltransferase